MAGRGGHGDGGTPSGGRPGRPHGGGGSESIAAAQEAVSAEAGLGRSGGGRGSGAGNGPGGRADDLVTHPTGEPGGTPDGQPTRIGPNEDADVRRSLERENSGATILADRGHQIKQNPSPEEVAQARHATGDSGKTNANPDYLLDGRVFDCYSPSETKPVRGVWSEVADKIIDGQTQRVVVNLQDWRGDLPALQRQFDDWPIENLKEVKVITSDGDIVQISPKPENG